MGFLFSGAYEVYFEEAEGNKKPTREAGYSFCDCIGLPFGDAQTKCSESLTLRKQKTNT